jgi:hypothetical protein
MSVSEFFEFILAILIVCVITGFIMVAMTPLGFEIFKRFAVTVTGFAFGVWLFSTE